MMASPTSAAKPSLRWFQEFIQKPSESCASPEHIAEDTTTGLDDDCAGALCSKGIQYRATSKTHEWLATVLICPARSACASCPKWMQDRRTSKTHQWLATVLNCRSAEILHSRGNPNCGTRFWDNYRDFLRESAGDLEQQEKAAWHRDRPQQRHYEIKGYLSFLDEEGNRVEKWKKKFGVK
ncbi:uncharacterized protein B0I36DRAFT_59521 [Microdochium trichocladiopsis]|uniref:Uncharacterized protein n=1 Tax=Microdochium trichocladiopsis TaxID=1682393 RepID=A0A9P8XR96_9PEZI|nr:uncharacterized protein B0I36DRAFT_59521 [Microdochium trichocladiopsis]KAH7009410.1 hypothetical protein B0I36DRAFT_59521 [Microdochium trichocladiopsis]